MNEWWAKVRSVFGRDRLDRVDDEMREELDAHLQMEVEAKVERGMNLADARHAASRGFGNRTAIREASRDQWTFVGLEALMQDLRYAVRWLRRAPGFAFTAIAIVALGVGATTAAFTVLDHVLLRPLPYPNADQLVLLFQNAPARAIVRMEATPPNFEDWRKMSQSFSAMGAYVPAEIPVNLSGQGDPLRLDGYMTSAAVFETLSVPAAVGRVFSADDERNDAAGVVLFSDGLATTLFGGPEHALGRTVSLDGRPSTIVGVMPKGFAFPYRDIEVWMPLRGVPAAAWNNRGNSILNVIARLRPDVSLTQARADMAVVGAQLERAYPKENVGVGIDVLQLRDVLSPASRTLGTRGLRRGVLLAADRLHEPRESRLRANRRSRTRNSDSECDRCRPTAYRPAAAHRKRPSRRRRRQRGVGAGAAGDPVADIARPQQPAGGRRAVDRLARVRVRRGSDDDHERDVRIVAGLAIVANRRCECLACTDRE